MASRWVRAQMAACGTVLAVGVVTAAVGVGPAPVVFASPQTLQLIQDAPDVLSQYPTLHLDMDISVSASGRNADVHETALTTPDGKTGSFQFDLPDDAGRIVGTFVHDTLYARLVNGPLPATGKPWVSLAHPRQSILSSGGAPTGADGLSYLKMLAGAGGRVRVLGHDDIDDVPTTHYQVKIDLADQLARLGTDQAAAAAAQIGAAGISEVPYDVWLDPQHQARRVEFEMEGSNFKMSVRVDIRGTHELLRVTAPSEAETYRVHDLREMMVVLAGRCC